MKGPALLLILPILSTAAPLEAAKLPLRHYTTENGLSHDRVDRIVRDSHGYLWFCTPAGLDLFDGTTFTPLGWGSMGAAPRTANDLVEDEDGSYWVATWGQGVLRLDPDSGDPDRTFTTFELGDGPQEVRVHSLLRDRKGRIWAGAMRGLFVLDREKPGARFRSVPLDPVPDRPAWRRIWTMMEDRRDTLWLGTVAGLLRRTADGRAAVQPILPGNAPAHVRALLEDEEGRIWVGHSEGLTVFLPGPAGPPAGPSGIVSGVRFPPRGTGGGGSGVDLPRSPGESRHFSEADGLARGSVTALLRSSRGTIWIASYAGDLTQFDGIRFTTYTTSDGLRESLSGLAEDGEGNLWIASDVGGAARLARYGFNSYGREEGVTYAGHAYVTAEDGGGPVLVADGRLWILRDGRFHSIAPGVAVWPMPPILNDSRGDWWFGAPAGLYRFDPVASVEDLDGAKPSAFYGPAHGLPAGGVRSLCEDSRGDIWMTAGDPGILLQWERAGDRFRGFSGAPGVPAVMELSSCAIDREGGLWMTVTGSLVRFRDGTFTVFDERDGLPPVNLSKSFVDSRGRLWVARSGAGLFRLDDPGAARPRFVRYTIDHGLSSDHVHGIAEGELGRIYVGTTEGIDRLDPETGRVRHYTTTDGLSNNEIDDLFRDSRGALWVTARRGVSVLHLRDDLPEPPAPPVRITEVSAGGSRLPVSALGESRVPGIELPSSRSDVEIQFAGVSFGLAGALKFQHQLQGIDEEWSPPSDLPTVNYARLSPDRYLFRVRAVNAEGLVSAHPAEVEFRILPPFWLRWWFLSACAAALGAVVVGLHRHRVRSAVEVERIRTRIATDLHDDVGASLSHIALLSDLTQARAGTGGDGLSQTLGRIAAESRAIVDSMSDIVWAINPAKDHLGDLTARMRRFASDLLSAREIAFGFSVRGDPVLYVGAEARREIYLIFKESLNNAVRHSGCRRIDVELGLEAGRVRLTVRDGGVGFDPAAATCSGNGLPSMRMRAGRMGGSLEVDSRPGAGAALRLTVPVAGARGRRWQKLFRRSPAGRHGPEHPSSS